MPEKYLVYTGSLVEKTCRDCQETKDVSEFHVSAANRSHLLKPRCVDCHRKYILAQYHNNATKYRARQIARQEERKIPSRKYVREYFESHPCADCGNDDWRVLEFDHVRGEKFKAVCELMAGPIEILIAEIEKCESVCANCHKIRTYTRAGSWKSNV